MISLLRGGRGPGLRLAVGGLAAACFVAGHGNLGISGPPPPIGTNPRQYCSSAERTFMSHEHEGRRQAHPQHLAGAGRRDRRHHRPDRAAAPLTPRCRLTTLDDAARAISTMQLRGAPLIGAAAAYGMCLALRADASDEMLERAYATLHQDAADRDQSEMGARRDGRRGAQPAARRARRRGLSARGGNLRRGRRHQPGDRPARPQADRGHRGDARSRRAGQCADPLQRRLACHRRLRHRDRADLHGARQGHRSSMSGSTRRGRATRALRSPPGSSASTAFRTP